MILVSGPTDIRNATEHVVSELGLIYKLRTLDQVEECSRAFVQVYEVMSTKTAWEDISR